MPERSMTGEQPMTLEEELRATRGAVEELTAKHRGQTRIVWALVALLIVITSLGIAGYRGLAEARCHGDQEAALNARKANEAVVTAALESVAADQTDEQAARFAEFRKALVRQQELLLPVPDC